MGSVPLMYQGSKYKPVPFAPIPISLVPTYVSSEVGNVNATTIAVIFSVDVTAALSVLEIGVTIKINGASASIINHGSPIPDNQHIRYVIGTPVISTDAVTWEYDASVGHIVSVADGTPLVNVTAQAVTNNVAPTPGTFPNPNGLDFFKLNEPLIALRGKVNSTGMDYFKLGEPFSGWSRTT